MYIFPPFKILARVVRKIRRDRATAIVIAPNWSGQPWFPLLHKLSEETRQPEQSRIPNFNEHITTKSNIIKGIPFLQESLEKEGIDQLTLEYFNKTWRSSTQKAYKSHLERWAKWTQTNLVDPIAPSVLS